MIICQTPFRISFFGGGTDYPAWYNEFGGSVLSTTINKYGYISCRHLPPFFDHKHRIVYTNIEKVNDAAEIDHPAVRAIFQTMGIQDGLEIHYDGDLPARSGVGSSSSFTVGLLNTLYALRGQMLPKHELASLAIHLEQKVIGESVGSQDQVAAAFGGINRIDFHAGGQGFSVRPVVIPLGVQTRLTIIYFCSSPDFHELLRPWHNRKLKTSKRRKSISSA
jgi:D-glycero-alpha-D-manno-heptose-7-phosphate kinase